MPTLPSLTARKIIRALKKAGFIQDRQKGSHLILINRKTKARTIVPVHSGKTMKTPLVHGIIKDAGLTAEKFIEFL